jgi:hypothetical protein
MLTGKNTSGKLEIQISEISRSRRAYIFSKSRNLDLEISWNLDISSSTHPINRKQKLHSNIEYTYNILLYCPYP